MSNNSHNQALAGKDKPASELFINCIVLAESFVTAANKLLSVWGMTLLQYTALNILYTKGCDSTGLPSGEIGRYIYTRVPDVTRLLDRLEEKDWIKRERDSINRRIVRVRLTGTGLQLVKSAEQPLRELQSRQLQHLSKNERNELNRLLKKSLNQSMTQ